MLNLEVQTSNEWHLLKGEHQFGPYTYEDMVRMKQTSLLFDFDYVWSPHLESWTLAGDLAEFGPDRMNRLIEKSPDTDVFSRRQHDRLNVTIPVLIHNDQQLWHGTCQNLSAGGALILIENPLLLPGDVVTVHMKAKDKLEQAFNCTAQVLTKRLVKTRIQHDTSLHYAVKFLNLTELGQKQISQIFKK